MALSRSGLVTRFLAAERPQLLEQGALSIRQDFGNMDLQPDRKQLSLRGLGQIWISSEL